MPSNSFTSRTLAFIAALLLGLGSVLSGAVAPVWSGQSPDAPTFVEQATVDVAFSADRAYEHVQFLSDQLGPRPLGSAAYDQAAQHALEQFRAWGYEASLQQFTVRAYSDRGSTVAVLAPGAETLAATTLQGSGGGEVEGHMVYVGLGRPAELTGLDLSGAVALVRRGEIRFGEKVANAAAAGAAAVVIFNNEPGHVQGSLGADSALPATTITQSAGERLVSLARADEVRLRVQVDAGQQAVTTSNVVARKPGTLGGGTVVVGGHLDTVPPAPGANDNASGSAVVLELARAYARQPYPYDLEFVLFGAEEVGLVGSREYVQALSPEQRQSIVAMINLDMVGVGGDWRFGGSANLVDQALAFAAQQGMSATELRGPLVGASDHASFLAADIPAVFIHLVNDPNYHSPNDRAEYVSTARLGEAGAVTLDLLNSLAAR